MRSISRDDLHTAAAGRLAWCRDLGLKAGRFLRSREEGAPGPGPRRRPLRGRVPAHDADRSGGRVPAARRAQARQRKGASGRRGSPAFDELAKELARGSDAPQLGRREVLRRLGAGLVGVLLASLGLGGAAVRPAHADDCFSQCDEGFGSCSQECESRFAQEMETGGRLYSVCIAACGQQDAPCKRVCEDTAVRQFSAARQSRVACGARCGDEHLACRVRCPCPLGYANCGGACVYLAIDPAHCGACGNVCARSTRCIDGQCRCPLTLSLCDELCIDTASHTLHCGGCGRVCRPYEFCSSGRCACGRPGVVCASGLTCCSGGPEGTRVRAACTDLLSDPLNCGRCDLACRMPDGDGYGVCCRGVCCAGQGFDCCGDECVNVLTDKRHCGGCGQACGGREWCSRGRCLSV